MVLKSRNRKLLESLEPERLCNRQPNTKKKKRAVSVFNYFVVFKIFLILVEKLQLDGTWEQG